MKSVAGRLRLDLAQYRELEAFASFSSDLDASSRATLDRGQRLVELLKQGQYQPYPVEREVVSLWLGTTGKLDRIPVSDVRRFESEFLDHIARAEPGVYDEIRTSRALGDDAVSSLDRAVSGFYRQFTPSDGSSLTDEDDDGLDGCATAGQRTAGQGTAGQGNGQGDAGRRAGAQDGGTSQCLTAATRAWRCPLPPRAAAPHPLHTGDEEDLLGAGADRRCPHRARPGPCGGLQALRP